MRDRVVVDKTFGLTGINFQRHSTAFYTGGYVYLRVVLSFCEDADGTEIFIPIQLLR